MRRMTSSILVVFMLSVIAIVPAQTGAHTASAFTVLVKENGFSQSAPEIFHNDSIIWYNTDNSSNLTHRLLYDHDGDGFYNGTFDWDSGDLHAYCETDENNSKVDPTCKTSYIVLFDMNWTEGDYDYQDLRSDGSTVNATIRLFADMDSHNASTAPTVGSSFGVTQEDETPSDSSEAEDEPLTPETVLLYIAMGTGGAAALLLVLLLVRRDEAPKHLSSEQE